MAVTKSLRIIGAWGISHQTLLIVILAVIVICAAIIGWRYAYLDYQLSTAERSVIDQTASSIDNGLLNTAVPLKTDIQIQTNSGGESEAKPVVKVNNQSISLPTNGEVHQVVQDTSGTTIVDVSVKSDTAGNGSSSSSTNVQFNSTSESTVESGEPVP